MALFRVFSHNVIISNFCFWLFICNDHNLCNFDCGTDILQLGLCGIYVFADNVMVSWL